MSTVSVTAAGGRVLRLAGASVLVHPRALAVTTLTAVAACAVAVAAVAVGEYAIPLPDVLRALMGTGDAEAALVVRELRLPRVVVGLLVGVAFGLAGGLTQAVVRNPLASPDVVGVTAGASAAAVSVIVMGWTVPLPLAALVGGLSTAALVAALSGRSGLTGPRLVLVGIGVGACAAAFTSLLLVRADTTEAQRATLWLTGSLNARSWEHARPVLVALAVLLPVVAALSRSLRSLRLGDDSARSLGVYVERDRVALVAVAVALAAVATASAGPVAFVGLVAPQVAVRLARTPDVPLLASGAVGALLVTAADVVARTAMPMELPVGAVTAVVGAPVLLVLLHRATRGTST